MSIKEIDKLEKYPYINKTFTYLVPQLIYLGSAFSKKFNNAIKAGVFVADYNDIKLNGYDFDTLIILLYDTAYGSHKNRQFENYLKNANLLVTSSYMTTTIKWLKIRVNEYLQNKIKLFVEGKYDELINGNGDKIYQNQLVKKVLALKNKDKHFLHYYLEDLEQSLGVSLAPEEAMQHKQWSVPPIAKFEILNTNSNKTVKQFLYETIEK